MRRQITLPALRFGDCPGCRTDDRRVPSAHVRRWPGVYRCIVADRTVATAAIEERPIDLVARAQVEAEVYGPILASAGIEVVTLLLLCGLHKELAVIRDAALLSAVDELVRVEIEEED